MSGLAAVSGVAYTGLGILWLSLTVATGPLGGAFLGIFQFGHLLAFAILRKPGVALITSLLSTVVQVLIGDPTGVYVLGWGVAHGVGAELVFILYRYRNAGLLPLFLAAGVAALFGHAFSYWLYGWEAAISLFWVSIPLVFLSSALESGLIAYAVARSLAQMGRIPRLSEARGNHLKS